MGFGKDSPWVDVIFFGVAILVVLLIMGTCNTTRL